MRTKALALVALTACGSARANDDFNFDAEGWSLLGQFEPNRQVLQKHDGNPAGSICGTGVASDLGQIRSLLGGGERGVLVEAGSAEALAEAIVRLAADREWAAQLGARARVYALGTLSWQRNARRALDAMATPDSELRARA